MLSRYVLRRLILAVPMLLGITLVLFLIYSLAPVFYLVVAATKSNNDLFTTFGFWFANFAPIPAVVPSAVPLITSLEPSTVACAGERTPLPAWPALL
mgnify:CR=1 FL=1